MTQMGCLAVSAPSRTRRGTGSGKASSSSSRSAPICGAEWDLDSANEEEGETFDGHHVISISAWCSAYDADEEAGRVPAPHPLSDCKAEFEQTLAQ